MGGTQGLLTDAKGALVELLGVGVVALDSVQLRQVVERRGDTGVVRAKRLLRDGE